VLLILLVLVWASLAWGDEPQTAVFDFDDTEVRGELVRPDVTLLFGVEESEASTKPPRWRARRARQLDRQLARHPTPEALAERADLLAVEGRVVLLEGYAGLDGSLDMDDALPTVERSEALWRRAIERYTQALPGLPVAEQQRVAHAAARLHEEVSTPSQAVAAWQQVLAVAPDHAEAHMALGQHAFADHDLARAAAHFERALSSDHDHGFATYMLAWTRYNQGDLDAAVTLMASLAASPGASRMLVEEAGRDLALFRGEATAP